MTIVMNMSGYEIERDTDAVEEYGDEVMQAGWNPQLQLVGTHAHIREPSLPAGMAEMDIDAFLKKMYALQR